MYSLQGVSVVIVDDHTHVRSIWANILNGFGIRDVHKAKNVRDAIELMENTPIDIAVIDMVMNDDMPGQKLIHYIRQNDKSPNKFLPIIVCTADTRRSCVYQIINAGADEILAKPLVPTAIWQRLVSVINQRRKFVKTPDYFGPDRRRVNDPAYTGPDRRDNLLI